MPSKTWTRGGSDASTSTTTTTKPKPNRDGGFNNKSSSSTKRKGTWTRGGGGDNSQHGDDTDGASAKKKRSGMNEKAAPFEPRSVKEQREQLAAKLAAVEKERAKLKAALEAAEAEKIKQAKLAEERKAKAKAESEDRQKRAGNLLSGFRGVRKTNEERVEQLAKPVENLSPEEIERRAVQRVLLAGSDWQTLDLPPGSQKKWVKKSYLELAKVLHPDKCSAPGAKEAFQKLNKAYKALS